MKKKRTLVSLVAFLCTLFMMAAPVLAAAAYTDIYELFTEWETNGYPEDVSSVHSTDGGSHLCVLLLEDTPEREAEIRALLEDDSGVTFGTGAYSYQEMEAVQNEIVQNYMGAGSPVTGCGTGWISVDGEVMGFGENGQEARVVVDVAEAYAEEYASIFQQQYGDMVFVQAGEGVANDAASDIQTDTVDEAGSNAHWFLLLAGILLILADLFRLKKHH